MPLVVGLDAYGRPVTDPNAVYQQGQNQPVENQIQQPMSQTAPQNNNDRNAVFGTRLDSIKDQGVQSTARVRYVQQQIEAQKQAERENQYMALQQSNDARAKSVNEQQATSLEDMKNRAAQQSNQAAQEHQDSQDRLAAQQSELDAQFQQKVSSIGDLGKKAFETIDKQSAIAAKSLGSGRGSTNTQGKTDLRSRLVAMVAKQKGIRYKWGGTSEKTGFDCSGLIQYAYGKLGVKMPRTSGPQSKMGVRTPINKLKPGDLVAHPGHIAVYAGNGMMWEAAHTGTRVRMVPVRSNMYGVSLTQLGK